MKFDNYITELFTTDVDLDIKSYKDEWKAQFRVDGIGYEFFASLTDDQQIDGGFGPGSMNRKSWEVSFYHWNSRRSEFPPAPSLRVFNAVVQAFTKFLKAKNPVGVWFSPSSRKLSKLYDRFERYMNKAGFKRVRSRPDLHVYRKGEKISEAVLQPKRNEVNLFINTIKQARKEWMKRKSYDRDRKSLGAAMGKVGKNLQKKIKDLEIIIKPGKKFEMSGGVTPTPGGDRPIWFEIFYDTGDAKLDWQDDFDFKIWLNRITALIEHELIHVEQIRRIATTKDISKATRIISDLKGTQMYSGKYEKAMDGYLTDYMEIMAHAKQVDIQIAKSNLSAKKAIEFLKKTDRLVDLEMESHEFMLYAENIRGVYPKTWKKFIKYLVMYLQKRIRVKK